MKLIVPTLMVAAVAGIGAYAAYRLISNKRGGGPLVMLGDPLELTQNRYYRGRLRMKESGAPPFVISTDGATLANALKLLGFSEVKVFMNEEALPSGWPSSTKNNVGPTTRWFEGQWRGPSASLPRPSDLELLWVHKPPPGATYTTAGVGALPCPPGKDCGCADCGQKGFYMRPAINPRRPMVFNSSYANREMP
jgi:hypothetical protein